jgi:putative membrane protein
MTLHTLALPLLREMVRAQAAAEVPRPDGRAAEPMVQVLLRGIVASLVYAVIGLVMFAVAFFVITRVVPFSVRKEIEDDQNTALGIVIASVIVGIAMILSAAIRG